MFGLSPKDIIQLRTKCLEPFIATASKTGIEKEEAIGYAEKAWAFAIKPLENVQEEIPARPPPDANQP